MRAAAVVFDLFGTLVDEASERDALEAAWRDARDRFELEASAAALAGDFAVALLDRVAEEPPEGPIGPYEAAAKDALDDVLAARGRLASAADRAWFWKVLLASTRAHVRAFPDAKPCLADVARRGIHVAVLTDADRAIAGLLLEATGLARHVASVTASAEAGAFKPDPAPFALALERAGCRPEEAWMVGDSWERDVEPALACGMRAVLLDRYGARTVAAPWKARDLAEAAKLVTGA